MSKEMAETRKKQRKPKQGCGWSYWKPQSGQGRVMTLGYRYEDQLIEWKDLGESSVTHVIDTILTSDTCTVPWMWQTYPSTD
jgi:hypothetical protein